MRPEDDPLKELERKNALEAGLELTRKTELGRFFLAVSHDADGVHNGGDARARWAKVFRGTQWQVEPWAEASWFSSEKADYYFGVEDSEVSPSRPAYAVGVPARYTAWRQHHFNLDLAYRSFADAITESPVVTESGVASVQFGYR
ncbi:MAG: outer membrane protein [Halieaceae bacterium]